MGTPQAAVPALQALASISELGLVVTRPDRPRGRSGRPVAPPVKKAALEAGLAVAQPTDRRQLVEQLSAQEPFEIGVVAAYGMLLPMAALALPRRGMVNIHFSLLPRWRGASPVVAAISAGDQESGVTLMQMDEGLDTGPLIAAVPLVIGDHETGGALAERLAVLGAELLTANLNDWITGVIEAVAQDEAHTTYAPAIRSSDRYLETRMSPEMAARRVRALAPRPGAILDLDGIPHQILAAEPVQLRLDPGKVELANGQMVVGMTGGGLRIQMIRPPSGRSLNVASWLRGRRQPPTRAGR